MLLEMADEVQKHLAQVAKSRKANGRVTISTNQSTAYAAHSETEIHKRMRDTEWCAQGSAKNPIDWYGATIFNDPRRFFQPSIAGARLIAETIRAMHVQTTEIFDWFGGQGLWSLALSANHKHVYDIEKPLSLGASCNFRKIDLSQGQFPEMSNTGLHIVDPPRAGLSKGFAHTLSKSAEQLIYISCDPATFARDVSNLRPLQLHEWHIVDQFPGTGHCEIVARFTK